MTSEGVSALVEFLRIFFSIGLFLSGAAIMLHSAKRENQWNFNYGLSLAVIGIGLMTMK